MRRRSFSLAVLASPMLSFAAPAFAQEHLHIEQPWARATPPMAKTGAAYLTISAGHDADRLVSASTAIAEKTEIHTSFTEGGVMKMRPVGPVAIAADKSVSFAPGGLHIMFLGLKQPLKAGESFPLTLTFEKGGAKTVTVTVRPIGAAASLGGDHGTAHGEMKH